MPLKLPIGIQDFRTLREEGYIYVDKTEVIFRLIHTAKFVFLSRPRRFGKSLLTTTLAELFQGHRELFQGLWIEKEIDWLPHPVILINFNDLDYLEMSLGDALTAYMASLARRHGMVLESQGYKARFQELIERLSEQGKVVLLVDEYDKPITDRLENQQQVSEHVEVLKNFYSVLKAAASHHLHFVLLTGVSKYGKISIFSDLNNLLDITLDPDFATLLGYTQAELETDFAPYLDQLTRTWQEEPPAILERIRFWYDGYSWDGVHQVYVPFSTLVFLEQQRFANHWFATATPSFLIKLLRQHRIPAYELAQIRGSTPLLDSADVEKLSPLSLLFQTGYLTIIQVERTQLTGENRYTLAYPNYEVAQAFQQHLLADYLQMDLGQISGTLLEQFRKSLQDQEVNGFVNLLRSLFARIPYQLFLPQEAYYHSVVYLVLSLLGFQIHAEQPTHVGRMDAVLELPEAIYILEFKMTTAQAALEQIRTRRYHDAFLGTGKRIYLLGLAFDSENRTIGDWAVETLT